jgi:carbon storage regulator CsrA
MLVIRRKQGEGVKLSNGVKIIVTRVNSRNVQLGIEAPSEVTISRCDNQNEKASTDAPKQT